MASRAVITSLPGTTMYLRESAQGQRPMQTAEFRFVGYNSLVSLPVPGYPVNIMVTVSNLANVACRDYLNRFRYFTDEPGRNVSSKINVPLSL